MGINQVELNLVNLKRVLITQLNCDLENVFTIALMIHRLINVIANAFINFNLNALLLNVLFLFTWS